MVLSVVTTAICATVARGWFGGGHTRATRLALSACGAKLPDFFLKGADTIAHCSVDPDLFRLRDFPQLRDGENGEQYMDIELLKGSELPPTRSEFVARCARLKLRPSEVGVVPYSVAEWTQRLTFAFAEHRKWPENPHVRLKCLVYAGHLAHYAQDLCQPLHTTIHFDGRAGEDGKSPRTGIHSKVDALVQKVETDRQLIVAGMKIEPLAKLLPGVLRELERSHALVDRVYTLEEQLPDDEAPIERNSEVARFATERLRACVRFTASLYLTAWENSKGVELPEWHVRNDE